MKRTLVLPLEQVGLKDLALVGGKSASLGEMLRNLSSLSIAVPDGFAVTTEVYWEFIRSNRLLDHIHTTLNSIDHDDVESSQRRFADKAGNSKCQVPSPAKR